MRILILIISLAIVGFLFYQYISHDVSTTLPEETGLNMNEGSTILDVPDYARDSLLSSQLQECLRLCEIDIENSQNCQQNCQDKYGQ